MSRVICLGIGRRIVGCRRCHLSLARLPLLHSRFGHCGARRLRQSVTRSANFPRHESLDHDPTDCDACQEGGARRRPFPKRVKQQFTMFGQRLSSDLCGPFPESVGGHKYALCIVDAATNFLYVEYLNTKSSGEVRAAFDRFLRRYKRELDACHAAGFDVTWRTHDSREGRDVSGDRHNRVRPIDTTGRHHHSAQLRDGWGSCFGLTDTALV